MLWNTAGLKHFTIYPENLRSHRSLTKKALNKPLSHFPQLFRSSYFKNISQLLLLLSKSLHQRILLKTLILKLMLFGDFLKNNFPVKSGEQFRTNPEKINCKQGLKNLGQLVLCFLFELIIVYFQHESINYLPAFFHIA